MAFFITKMYYSGLTGTIVDLVGANSAIDKKLQFAIDHCRLARPNTPIEGDIDPKFFNRTE